MIFYNDEGSENRASSMAVAAMRRVKWSIHMEASPSISTAPTRSFSSRVYAGVDDKDDRFAGLAVSDQNRRIWVGRTDDGTTAVSSWTLMEESAL
jgi:hypothetical protein